MNAANIMSMTNAKGFAMRDSRAYKLTKEQRAGAVARYVAGESAPRVAASLGVQSSAIYQLLRSRGIPSRLCTRRHSLNEAAFDEWTPEAAYWAGFLFADGCVTTQRNSTIVSVGLSEKDRHHLEKFREFLGSSHGIHFRESGGGYRSDYGSVRFAVSSHRLGERLKGIGIVKGRGAVLDDALTRSRDFWRGVVDGDGTLNIAQGTPVLCLLGHRLQLEQYMEFVRGIWPETAVGVRRHHGEEIFVAGLSGQAAKHVAAALYDGSVVSLERKAAVASAFTAWTCFYRTSCETANCNGRHFAKGYCKQCHAARYRGKTRSVLAQEWPLHNPAAFAIWNAERQLTKDERARTYHREWKRTNKDRANEQARKRRRLAGDEYKAKRRSERKQNRERENLYHRRWVNKHRDNLRAYQRSLYASRSPEKVQKDREYLKAWRAKQKAAKLAALTQ